jgi:hypothetical protein
MYGLFSGRPAIASLTVAGGTTPGRALVIASNLLAGHNYVEQQASSLSPANWSNAINFIFTPAEGQTNSVAILTNAIGSLPNQFWRILAP